MEDTDRKVGQLDSDVHEIYGLLKGLRESSNEQWGMLRRQGNRLNSLEANVAQLAEDVTELKADVAGLKADVSVLKVDVAALKADVAELKGSVGEILELLRSGPSARWVPGTGA